MRAMQDVVVDEQIVAKESELVLHVGEQSTDKSCEVDHMSWLVLVENGLCLRKIPTHTESAPDTARVCKAALLQVTVFAR